MNEKTLRNLLSLAAEQAIDSIQIFDEIDSTNTELLRQIRAGETRNGLIIASAQSAGKGRRGRAWISPKNSGIYLSLARGFSQDANSLQGLSLVTAVSLVEALEALGANGLQLKWPNDVMHEKRKLAGILLELQQRDAEQYVVFGIGINIELSQESVESIDRPVTDTKSILGKHPENSVLVASVLNQLCENLSEYESHGFSVFEERWNMYDCYRMSDIVIQNGESRIIGKSLGVDAGGALLLQTANGIQSINGGEVFPSLRPISDENRPV